MLDTKKKLVTNVAASIHHAYMIPDTRVFLRKWSAEQISVDGQLGADASYLHFRGAAWTRDRG
jgi:hypothetical protein